MNSQPNGAHLLADLLLDTNALSAAMAGNPALDAYLANLGPETHLFTSVIAEGEVRFGLARLADGHRKRALTAAFEAVLGSLHGVLETTRDVAAHYGILKASLWELGKPIGENDIWIASTGRARGLTVLSRDPDFAQVPDLQVENWSSA